MPIEFFVERRSRRATGNSQTINGSRKQSALRLGNLPGVNKAAAVTRF